MISAAVSSFYKADDIVMSMIAPKLSIIATISNGVMASLRKIQPSSDDQKGAVLKIVFCTTKGTIATPKVIVVKPSVATKLLVMSKIRS